MHDCREILAALSSYLDDEVAADLRLALEAHLGGCEPCRAVYDATRKTLKLLLGTRAIELSPGFSESLMGLLERHGGAGPGGEATPGS